MCKIITIIVTYNGCIWIDKCIGSLKKSSIQNQIIVIDNFSTDQTINYIKENYPDVLIIQNKNNLGFGKANNIGLNYAIEENADYIFLLNQDAWVEPDTIKYLVEFQKMNKEFGIVSPIHLNGKGSELDKNFSTCITFSTLSLVNDSIESGVVFEKTYFVNAACWLISKECLLKVGGFDPLFPHYGEDRDFCNRVIFYGFQIGVIFNTTIIHDRHYSNNNNFRKEKNLIYSSALAYTKNINKNILSCYSLWLILSFKQIIKSAILMRYRNVLNESIVLFKIIYIFKDIKISRKYCSCKEKAYLL